MIVLIRSERVRRVLRILLPFVFIPAVVAAGMLLFGRKSYAFVSFVVALLSLLLFCAGFERRTVGTRRLVIVAVMTALSVVGRLVFTPVPGFKPITAMVVITAVYLGGESGFLVGALSALISNFTFGQGPWTPFQMLAWGLIGLLAGYLAAPLKRSRAALALYGALAGVAYSVLMDVWTVLWYDGGFHWGLYLASLLTALPHTLSYALSNVVFLLWLGRPFGEKLERVKIKYGV